jgi:N-acetylmuramoyl-L-alanine amidase
MSRPLRFTILWSLLISMFTLMPISVMADNAKTTFDLKLSSQGTKIEISVSGKNLNDVYAYDLTVKYDSARLKFIGAHSAFSGFSVDPIVKHGIIRSAHTKTGNAAGESGDKELSVLTFERVAEGNANITLQAVQLVNSKLEMTELKPVMQVTVPGKSVSVDWKDIKGHWAEASIREAAELGFVTGYADGTFLPNRAVTRAEFSAMIVRALHLEYGAADGLSFSDNERIAAWAKPYIAAAVKAGLLNGYSDGSFRADKLINRTEMVAIIMRALDIKSAKNTKLQFADSKEIPVWATGYVAAAVETGIIKGRNGNRFEPNGQATRAEAVTVILAMLKYTGT